MVLGVRDEIRKDPCGHHQHSSCTWGLDFMGSSWTVYWSMLPSLHTSGIATLASHTITHDVSWSLCTSNCVGILLNECTTDRKQVSLSLWTGKYALNLPETISGFVHMKGKKHDDQLLSTDMGMPSSKSLFPP